MLNKYRNFFINGQSYDTYIIELSKKYDGDSLELKHKGKSKEYCFLDEIVTSFDKNLSLNKDWSYSDLRTLLRLFLIYLKKGNSNEIENKFKESVDQYKNDFFKLNEDFFPPLEFGKRSNNNKSKTSSEKYVPNISNEVIKALDNDLIFTQLLKDSIISLNLTRERNDYMNFGLVLNRDKNIGYDANNNKRYHANSRLKPFLVYDKETGDIKNKHYFKSTKDSFQIRDYTFCTNYSVGPNVKILKSSLKIITDGLSNIIDYGHDENGTNVYIIGGSLVACLESLPVHILELYNQTSFQKRTINSFKMSKLLKNQIKGYLVDDCPFVIGMKNKFKYLPSDIDILITAPTLETGKSRLKKLLISITNWLTYKKNYQFRIVRTPNTVTILGEKFRPIQLVTMFNKTINEHFLYSDMDCTAIAFNGENVLMSPRAQNAFNSRSNIVPIDLDRRANKYITRNFGKNIFEHCKHLDRCNVTQSSMTEKTMARYDSIPLSNLIGMEINYIDQWLRENIGQQLFVCSSNSIDYILGDHLVGTKTIGFGEVKNFDWKINLVKLRHWETCYQCKKKYQDSSFNCKSLSLENRPPNSIICEDCTRANNFYKVQINIAFSGVSDVNNTKIALVTGGRIKIGFECAIALLGYGFRVIITTRFPRLANEAFKTRLRGKHSSKTASELLNRLHIFGLDFRNVSSVEQFINHIEKDFGKIDILIQNAAQTIRRPRAYYHSLLTAEKEFNNLVITKTCRRDTYGPICRASDIQFGGISSTSIIESKLLPEDENIVDNSLFPPNQLDPHNEPLDLRQKTTWNSNIESISALEFAEVQIINTIVPTLLVSKLVPLMKKSDNEFGKKLCGLDCSYIIHVTSTEGIINNEYNNLSGNHVHTNMAKAGLDSLTKSIAKDLEKKSILVYGVNTGWISKMSPIQKNKNKRDTSPEIPLSCEDGAYRILFPIFESYFNVRIPVGSILVNNKISNNL